MLTDNSPLPLDSDREIQLLRRLAVRVQTDWIDWLPSAARTILQVSPAIDCRGYSTLAVLLDITVWTAGGVMSSLREALTDAYLEMSPAYIAAAVRRITFFSPLAPRAAAGSTLSEVRECPLPASVKIGILHQDANPITYSVKYQLLP